MVYLRRGLTRLTHSGIVYSPCGLYCKYFPFSSPITSITADFKLAYIQSAVSWANDDRIQKFKIMVVHFEKFASYLLSMN